MTAASGYYILTLEKQLIDTAAQSMEAETHNTMLVLNAYTPNFETHDFRADVTDESSGTGYSAGGQNLTSTELTVSSGSLIWDAADQAWATSTITARAAINFFDTGNSATDMLISSSAFASDASSSGGTFTVQWASGGIVAFDCTP